MSMRTSTRITAIALLFFNALSAMYGGGSLIYDPSGDFLQMPIELLEHTPFRSYLIPGMILFAVNGVFNLWVGIIGLRRNRQFPWLTMLCGAVLIIWLTIQIIMIRDFFVYAHVPYYLVGLLLVLVGFKLSLQNRST